MQPPLNLKDCRDEKQIQEDSKLADEFASRGTVKHFLLRQGFMPYDEDAAEKILERCLLELDWYRSFGEQS